MLSYRIAISGGPEMSLTPVGECIYCRRKPPEGMLTDEHIIADGFGGDLILPASSCTDCAALTGWFEQDILRNNLRQPRGVLGIRSRKKRAKQTSYRVNVAPGDEDPPVLKDIDFQPGMPAFLISVVGDHVPGILRLAPKDEPWMGRVFFATPRDFNERGMNTLGEGTFRHRFKFHAGLFGQMIAKTAHAFAVAALGVNGFEPFLTDYIRAKEPPFDGYHLASLMAVQETEYLHEIWLERALAPISSAIGIGVREVIIVKWRIFGQLSGPLLMAVVGKPVKKSEE